MPDPARQPPAFSNRTEAVKRALVWLGSVPDECVVMDFLGPENPSEDASTLVEGVPRRHGVQFYRGVEVKCCSQGVLFIQFSYTQCNSGADHYGSRCSLSCHHGGYI